MIGFIKNNATSVVNAIQAVLAVCNIWTLLLAAVSLILLALGLYRLAKHRAIDKPWLAWLPIGNLWILGALADQFCKVVCGKEKVNSATRLAWLSAICLVLLIAIAALIATGLTYMVDEVPVMNLTTQMQEELSSLTGDALLAGYVKLMAQMVESNATVARTVNTGLIGLCVLLAGWAAAGLWLAVEKYRALYFLYRSCLPRHAVWLLVVSILPVADAVIVFICRKQNQGMLHDKKGRIQVF